MPELRSGLGDLLLLKAARGDDADGDDESKFAHEMFQQTLKCKHSEQGAQ